MRDIPHSPPQAPPEEPDLPAEILDGYLSALQKGDQAAEAELLAAHPALGPWTACLRGLDGLAAAIAGEGEAEPAAALPRVFGPYELLAELGRGGMGVVYRARHVSLGRDVAVKFLAGGVCASGEQRRRFLAEARLAARIRHPRIVSIHDAGDRDGQLWCAMDLVDGDDLAALLRDGPLPVAEAVHLVVEVARAVHHLHTSGILHRDVKSSTILLDASRTPYLTDFGLARGDDGDATMTGTVLGTPASMSPEQAAGRVREIDARSDVYGLGTVLYEALCGTPPFGGTSAIDTLLDVLEREPLPPSHYNPAVPPLLDRVCLRCLEKAPSRRPTTAAALVLTDVIFVTGLLALVDGKSGPLVAVYPLLVTAAGLWLDRRLVRVVTCACLAAHLTLQIAAPGPVVWHVALILDVLMLCTAAITDFQIGRIRLPRAATR